MSTRFVRRTVGKAASYTVSPAVDAPGTTFTNKGATGAITFTLPAAVRALLGWHYRFRVVVDQDLVVAAAAVDTLLGTNDAAADSVALSTTNEKLGGLIEVECVEVTAGVYQWAASVLSNGHTQTVAT